ncbi:MAG: hypothetical protein HOU01_12130 [Streptomycetaceae bacterium]|nr:hypothetical protein [Streptomycetaceae bacterium]
MWLGALLLGLVGVLLCVTLILLPLGIPILGYARRLFTSAVRLMLPRAVAHPVKELRDEVKDQGKATGKATRNAADSTSSAVGDASRKGRKAARKARKRFA